MSEDRSRDRQSLILRSLSVFTPPLQDYSTLSFSSEVTNMRQLKDALYLSPSLLSFSRGKGVSRAKMGGQQPRSCIQRERVRMIVVEIELNGSRNANKVCPFFFFFCGVWIGFWPHIHSHSIRAYFSLLIFYLFSLCLSVSLSLSCFFLLSLNKSQVNTLHLCFTK